MANPRSSGSGTSSAFASLKDIKEDIKINLTTAQYLRTLDSLLDRSIEDIILHTAYIDTCLIRLIGWQERNHRRKISFRARKEVPALVTTFLLAKEDERMAAFRKIKLDRGLRVELVKAFLAENSKYVNCCELAGEETRDEALKYKRSVENTYKCGSMLYSICRKSESYLSSAIEFRAKIQQKYVRHILMTARRDFDRLFSTRSVQLDDMVQVYWMAALRAIDKCDPDEGTLTTHITNWFYTAREHVYRGQEKSLSLDNMLNSASISGDSNEDMESIEELREQEEDPSLQQDGTEEQLVVGSSALGLMQAAKIADPTGAARALLGIPEILSESELATLNSLKE